MTKLILAFRNFTKTTVNPFQFFIINTLRFSYGEGRVLKAYHINYCMQIYLEIDVGSNHIPIIFIINYIILINIA